MKNLDVTRFKFTNLRRDGLIDDNYISYGWGYEDEANEYVLKMMSIYDDLSLSYSVADDQEEHPDDFNISDALASDYEWPEPLEDDDAEEFLQQ